MAVIERPQETPSILSVAGIFITAFSIAMGLLVLFVIPFGCGFVASIGLVILFFLLIAGLILLLVATFRSKLRRPKLDIKQLVRQGKYIQILASNYVFNQGLFWCVLSVPFIFSHSPNDCLSIQSKPSNCAIKLVVAKGFLDYREASTAQSKKCINIKQ